MVRIVKFLRLPVVEQRLWMKAYLLLISVRMGLWILPFQRLQSWLAHFSATPVRHKLDPYYGNRMIRALKVLSAYVPRATCLTQALAAQVWLERHGYATRMQIGVAKDEAGRLQAHAWLECGGNIVIGDSGDLSRYTLLPALGNTQT